MQFQQRVLNFLEGKEVNPDEAEVQPPSDLERKRTLDHNAEEMKKPPNKRDIYKVPESKPYIAPEGPSLASVAEYFNKADDQTRAFIFTPLGAGQSQECS